MRYLSEFARAIRAICVGKMLFDLSLTSTLSSGVTPGARSSGEWDSIHVFEATDRARMSHYKLTSTVILHLANENETLGEMDLSGNMTRQVEVDLPVDSDASHVANVGRLVEDMELKMRNLLRMFFSHFVEFSSGD